MATRFAHLLQKYFTERLMKERQASPRTIASYSDAFRILLDFLGKKHHKSPSQIDLEDLDACVISEFLQYLQDQRGNSARTRNARLAAIHSFFNYAAFHEPKLSALIQRVLAIPTKRWTQKEIDFLTREEVDVLLGAIDVEARAGYRDRALLALLAQAGLRVSEVTALRCEDIELGKAAHIRCEGKGRKLRCVPLRQQLALVLGQWLKRRHHQPSDPLFPNARGEFLSRDGVAYILKKHVAVAGQQCPSLAKKHVTPHVLRHTLAMDLLHQGVDRSTMALWLGHESIQTIQCYLHADLELKQKALEKTEPWDLPATERFRPTDTLLTFLEGLVMSSEPAPDARKQASPRGG